MEAPAKTPVAVEKAPEERGAGGAGARAAGNADRVGLYEKNVITRRVYLSYQEVGSNLKQNLEERLREQTEGRCVEEGFVRSGSCRIIQYSSGEVEGNQVAFQVMAECLVCFPVEGMVFPVVVRDVTTAGIRAERDEPHSPVNVFIARDHNFDSRRFNSVKEGDSIKVRVIGQRFEVNDERISVIAELMHVFRSKN
jgi:DNA-directed RNA polymerase subunit E'/Rpb7